jgi:hypothetical protein
MHSNNPNRFGHIRVIDGLPTPVVSVDDDGYITIGENIPPILYRHNQPVSPKDASETDRRMLEEAFEQWHRAHTELYMKLRKEYIISKKCLRCGAPVPIPKKPGHFSRKYCSTQCAHNAKIMRYRQRQREKEQEELNG